MEDVWKRHGVEGVIGASLAEIGSFRLDQEFRKTGGSKRLTVVYLLPSDDMGFRKRTWHTHSQVICLTLPINHVSSSKNNQTTLNTRYINAKYLKIADATQYKAAL